MLKASAAPGGALHEHRRGTTDDEPQTTDDHPLDSGSGLKTTHTDLDLHV